MPKRIQRKRTKAALTRAAYHKKWSKSKTRPRAKCHPEKPHRARGMCETCYNRWLYKNSHRNRSTKLRNAKSWRSKNIERVRAGQRRNHLKGRYGLTEKQYQQMMRRQKGRCAICEQPGMKLHIDHDHDTGKVRGLLCLPCNGKLAWLEELMRTKTTPWISTARCYLIQHGSIAGK